MIKSYKYRLNPTKEQKIFFEKSFGCARFVYNWALDRKIKAFQEENKRLHHIDLCKDITLLKKDNDKKWLNEVSSQCLQQSILNMDNAFVKFFREKRGFPNFKSKHEKQAYKVITGIQIDFLQSKIKLPKIGWLKFFNSREFTGKIGTVTVSKSKTGKYYVSIVVDNSVPLPNKSMIEENTSIGIDVGIKTFATLSNGTIIENPKYYEKYEKRLKVLQRRLSKKQKGSKRRERAKLQLTKQHEKISNLRTNFLHQITTKIVSENQTIIIEDLNVSGMQQNHKLAKSISSASWAEFYRMLEYKCDWYGRNLVRIGRFYPSSKMCTCGHINSKLQLSDRKWTCSVCGMKHNRDLLAAQNIKRFGLQKQNLIGQSPAVCGEGRVELPSIVGAKKREAKSVVIQVTSQSLEN